MRKLFLFSVLLLVNAVNSQELNCVVTVNYDKVTNANTQIFKSLERSLNEFVNNNAWTEQEYKANEKINCSMFITINSYEGNNFDTTIQVQSSRTIFNEHSRRDIVHNPFFVVRGRLRALNDARLCNSIFVMQMIFLVDFDMCHLDYVFLGWILGII